MYVRLLSGDSFGCLNFFCFASVPLQYDILGCCFVSQNLNFDLFSIHFHKTNGKHAESSQHEILLLLTFVFYHHFVKIIVLCVPGGKKGAIPFKPFDRTCLYLYIYYICHSLAGQFVKDASAVCIFLPLIHASIEYPRYGISHYIPE